MMPLRVRFSSVVGPGAIAAAVAAEKETKQRRDQVCEALKRDLEAARYAAESRLPAIQTPPTRPTGWWPANWRRAGTRRSHALRRSKARSPSMKPPTPGLLPIRYRSPRSRLTSKTVWIAASTDARLKKRIVRTVIHEVIADIDPEAAEIVLVVHWVGGVHTRSGCPNVGVASATAPQPIVIAAVRQLVLIAKDDLIAAILNRNGLVTGYGNRWTRERVTSLRSHHTAFPSTSPPMMGSSRG